MSDSLSSSTPLNASYLDVARAMRREGKPQIAAEYLMHWLHQIKDDSQAWELLAYCMTDLGQHDKAEIAFRKAIAHDETRTDLAIPLATALLAQSQSQAAIEVLQLALGSDPENQDLQLFLGVQLAAVDRQSESLACFLAVAKLNPDNHVAWAFKSLCHTRLKEYSLALEDAQRSISLNADFAQAWFAKGRVLQKMGLWHEAAECLEQALKLHPHHYMAQDLLTSIKVTMVENQGNAAEITQLSQSNLRTLITNEARKLQSTSPISEISYFKLKHDVEQAQFLMETGLGGRECSQLVRECASLVSEYAWNPAQKIQLPPQHATTLAAFWLSLKPCSLDPIASGCLNQEVDWTHVERQYLESTPEIVVIDNFLSLEALHAFQRFNLMTPAWTREYADNKYLGAFSSMGYATPLHFQLASDLRRAMPRVFLDHRLMEFWGFKYDALIGKGINVHADHAQVNLNFWVTPDEYNLDTQSGGLKVYDVPPPPEWSFDNYNSNSSKIYEFLNNNCAKSHTVTYQCNRAVLFNSALFHETDTIHFQDVYQGRRVNMTYLFGEQLGI
jgi:tetratricopeptide (TPR) repeat protein